MSAFRRDEDGTYHCSAFDEFPWQHHGFGTRAANPPAHVTLRQVHSAMVRNARFLADREAEGDALVTDEVGRMIGVRTADCVPILVLDRSRQAVSAVHAGWRGTAAQIVRHAIQILRDEFSSEPDDLFLAIGPCIRQCCYEVSSDVAEQFSETHTTRTNQTGKWNLDLAAANRSQMLAAGIRSEHIFDLEACTVCRAGEFFSYRREPHNPGRMVSSIGRLACI